MKFSFLKHFQWVGTTVLALFFGACDELPRCNDGRRNGLETEIDCGGECPPCYTCDDGIKNQDETLTDCGGEQCDFCPGEWQPLNASGNFIFSDISATTENQLFAAGQTRWAKSGDGGETWATSDLTSMLPNGGAFRRVHFFDAQRGVILGAWHNAFASFGFSLTTSDGGLTWQYHDDNLFNGNQFDAWFRSPGTIYVFDGFSLRTSIDAGFSFQEFQSADIPADMKPVKVFFFNEKEGVLQAISDYLNSKSPFSLFKTSDGGATWQFAKKVEQDFEWSGLRMFTPSVGFCSGWLTGDGGATWRQFAAPISGKLFFEDANTAYLIGNLPFDEVFLQWKSTDGGATWHGLGLYNQQRRKNMAYVFSDDNLRIYKSGKTFFVANGLLMKLVE